MVIPDQWLWGLGVIKPEGPGKGNVGSLPGSHYCVGWPMGPWWEAGWGLMSFQRKGRSPGGGDYPWKAAAGIPPKVQGWFMKSG